MPLLIFLVQIFYDKYCSLQWFTLLAGCSNYAKDFHFRVWKRKANETYVEGDSEETRRHAAVSYVVIRLHCYTSTKLVFVEPSISNLVPS